MTHKSQCWFKESVRSQLTGFKSMDANAETYLALLDLLDSDDLDGLLLLLQPLEQRLGENKVVSSAVVDRERREAFVEPVVEPDVEQALAAREAALARPPEDGRRAEK